MLGLLCPGIKLFGAGLNGALGTIGIFFSERERYELNCILSPADIQFVSFVKAVVFSSVCS